MSRTLRVLAVGAVLAVALFGTAETALRLRSDAQQPLRKLKCSRPDPMELVTLREDCTAQEDSPAGPYRFQTNELGLRDRPMRHFSSSPIFLMGDSHAQGLYLRDQDTLGRVLEASLAGKISVLNLGVQSHGPGQQYFRFLKITTHLRPAGILWIINPTDYIDELYYQKVIRERENHPAGKWSPPFRPLDAFNEFLGGQSQLLLKGIEYFYMARPFQSFVRNERFQAAVHCRGIIELNEQTTRAGIPLAFLVFAQGPADDLPYRGFSISRDEFQQLIDCLKATGRPILDLRPWMIGKPQLFWPADWHLNGLGMAEVSKKLVPLLNSHFLQSEKKPPRTGHRQFRKARSPGESL